MSEAVPPEEHATFGVVMVSGSQSHSLAGRDPKKPTKAWDGVPEHDVTGFHLLPGLSGVSIAKVVASSVACHYVAISSDGVAYVWGRNENGQLGTGNTNNVYLPCAVAQVSGVVDAAVGKGHTLLLTRSGSLWAAGSTNKGQCGVGKISEQPLLAWTPCRISGIVKVAAGNEFSICCDKDGRLYSCGSKENGQTGLGKTGERIETAGKVTFDFVHTFVMHQTGEIFGQKVIDVSCGAVHGACLTDVGTVYTWGCGGFGRLGHKNVEEQLLPTKVAFFGDRPDRKCRLVACGASCTYFTCGHKEMTAVYMCGILAKTGEANTYPKPIQELSGWSVRTVSAGPQSTIVAAADALVTWGNSPMVGELGYGPQAPTKSSSKPKLVDDLDGCHVIMARMGLCCSVILVDASSQTPEGEKMRKHLAAGKFPTVPDLTPAGSKAAAKQDGKGAPAAKRAAGAADSAKAKKGKE